MYFITRDLFAESNQKENDIESLGLVLLLDFFCLFFIYSTTTGKHNQFGTIILYHILYARCSAN